MQTRLCRNYDPDLVMKRILAEFVDSLPPVEDLLVRDVEIRLAVHDINILQQKIKAVDEGVQIRLSLLRELILCVRVGGHVGPSSNRRIRKNYLFSPAVLLRVRSLRVIDPDKMRSNC